MLIVNADDFGMSDVATERILQCLRERVITSTTAMVYEAGSVAAAERARSEGWQCIGIHVNLSRRYTAADVPGEVRECQAQAVAALDSQRLGPWLQDPRIQGVVDRCIADQLHRFRALYGREPTHVDSHHHMHLRPNVFRSAALPAEASMRNTLIHARRHGPVLDLARRGRQRLLERRFATPAAIICLDVLVREWPRDAIGPAVAGYASRLRDAEVMVHPEDPAELAFLLSDDWRRALDATERGSFADWRRTR